MSHVDEGTIHAYLDGALPPVEVGRIAQHLAGCEQCRTRVAEERALIERASSLLALAVPGTRERPAPPLHALRHRRSPWSVRLPLAWAATVVLALGLGWFVRGSAFKKTVAPDRNAYMVLPEAPPGPLATVEHTPARPAPAQQTRTDRQTAPVRKETGAVGAVADRGVLDERRDTQPAAKVAAASPASLGLARTEPRNAPVAPSAAAEPDATPIGVVQGAEARGPSDQIAAWPAISLQSARELLGTGPVVVPGLPVRALRRNPAGAEIMVEQSLPDGVVIRLHETPAEPVDALARRSRDDRAPAAAAVRLQAGRLSNERLARFVGGLRVEISGSIPPDSLSKLLELVR